MAKHYGLQSVRRTKPGNITNIDREETLVLHIGQPRWRRPTTDATRWHSDVDGGSCCPIDSSTATVHAIDRCLPGSAEPTPK
ncbi:hypothetical protein KIN20_033356 [Parelaphostrongylus tenuis]|uniref:Uncharacterized protein n=1 Tax=Parelaphostrongylus tenuis TaxID=148309 RepID=A0AAD5WIT2_PARTN|nr:hypothetical protein KIN20_033356 [Parelaphostrongylus tenuis]